jgi:hypothetical protein
MKKGFTYVAAIALLTAGTAFAQAQSGAAGANSSTINNSTPTPAAKGPAEGVPRGAGQPGTMMDQSSSGMNQSGSSMGAGSSMNQSSDMNAATKSKARSHHGMSSRSSGNDAKENQETMRLNRQQLGGTGASNNAMPSRGTSSSNPFNKGSPQQAQAGGANCMPDNPSCGTARGNPAINSSPQHRTYGNQQQ